MKDSPSLSLPLIPLFLPLFLLHSGKQDTADYFCCLRDLADNSVVLLPRTKLSEDGMAVVLVVAVAAGTESCSRRQIRSRMCVCVCVCVCVGGGGGVLKLCV